MNDSKDRHLGRVTLPIGVGLMAYVAGRFCPLIAKDWTILPRIEGSGFLAGLLDGLGSVRNLSAIFMSLAATTLTSRLLTDAKTPSNRSAASIESISEVDDQSLSMQEYDHPALRGDHRHRVASGNRIERVR
jgi:hypothetical protein